MVGWKFRARGGRCYRGHFYHLFRRAYVAPEMKSELYPRLYLWLVAHRRYVLIAAGLIALICVAISSRISLEEDILATLPQHDRIVDEYKYTIRKFHEIDRV